MESDMHEERLAGLFRQIELAWYEQPDYRLVDKLAAENPTLAKELYEFFALVVKSRREYGKRRPELAEDSRRTRDWLEREGFAIAAAARRGAQTTTTGEEATATRTEAAKAPSPASFVATLKKLTGETSLKALAAELDIPPQFLVLVSEHSEALTPGARTELVERATRKRKIAPAILSESLSGGQYQLAASRDTPIQQETLTYEQLVKRAKMDKAAEQFWLSKK
jgi:hypothetical protein